MQRINKVTLLTITKGQPIFTDGRGNFQTGRAIHAGRIKGAIYTLLFAVFAYLVTVAVIL